MRHAHDTNWIDPVEKAHLLEHSNTLAAIFILKFYGYTYAPAIFINYRYNFYMIRRILIQSDEGALDDIDTGLLIMEHLVNLANDLY